MHVCELCCKRAEKLERFTYGPMVFRFCNELHEQRYWDERAINVDLYKWLRASPERRTDKLLIMTADERRFAERCCKALSKARGIREEVLPTDSIRPCHAEGS